jgi:hypothetical protein
MTGSVLSLNGHSAPRPPRQRGALFSAKRPRMESACRSSAVGRTVHGRGKETPPASSGAGASAGSYAALARAEGGARASDLEAADGGAASEAA